MLGSSWSRRRIMAFPMLCFVPSGVFAGTLQPDGRAAMLAFDQLYIRALFLTGGAGKSASGAAKATAAMQRLVEQWPVQRQALLAAVPSQPIWAHAVDGVLHKLKEADASVARSQWESAHEELEQVREILFEARQKLGMDYALDRFTAYHAAMEKLANAKTVRKPEFEADYVKARVLWHRIETLQLDAAEYGLTPDRAQQLTQARAAESDALSRLSAAIHGAADDEILKAASALKAPFVRAYIAFGSAP